MVLVADACYATLAVRRRFDMRFKVPEWILMLPQAQACRWSVCGRRVLAISKFLNGKDVGQAGETPRKWAVHRYKQ